MNVVERWKPVTNKCSEFNSDQIKVLSQLLDNQYNVWVDDDLSNLADYVRFALPLVRKTLIKLFSKGFTIESVELSSDDDLDVVELANFTEYEFSRFLESKEDEILEAVSDRIVETMLESFPGKQIAIRLICIPNPFKREITGCDKLIGWETDLKESVIVGDLAEIWD